jgi:NADPH-dependent 7-cyano-7-deazaguanine reductase QueF-like protein
MLYRKILPLLMKECSSRSIELYLYSFEQERAINVEEVKNDI